MVKQRSEKWWSPSLQQEMEFRVYGDHGKPVLVFPSQDGRFFDFENNGLLASIGHLVESKKICLYTVDSVDAQSWSNRSVSPFDRARRHCDYDRYIRCEVIPFIHHVTGQQKMITTGCSMGGYHSANFFFKYPDCFDTLVALSGVYNILPFTDYMMDENIYFNSPLHYLPELHDQWFLDQYRQSKIVLCVGHGMWEEEMIHDTHAMRRLLDHKRIPAWVDFWGTDAHHDWEWWQKQLPYFMEKVL